MKLKRHKFLSIAIGLIIPGLMVSSGLFISCSEDGDGMHIESPNGDPRVRYVRMADPEKKDSLIIDATLGTNIVLMGENLGGTREIWFNDKKAPTLSPSFVTNETVFVTIPSSAPDLVTDKMYIIDANSDTLVVPFIVSIPPPAPRAARNEWPLEDENLVIIGDYFFPPLTVTFTGGVQGEVVAVTQTGLEVTIPDGAVEGPVTVVTNFGETESTFHMWDSRNIILDFDNTFGNGWRKGLRENADGPLDGNYLVVRGDIDANQRVEGPDGTGTNASPLMMEYWGGAAGRTENFYPVYPNSYKEYVLKFKTKIKSWYGGHLNIVLAPLGQSNNSDVWNNPFVNARAVWGPWCEGRGDDNATCTEGEEFTTDEQWITVVIPLTDFQYDMGTTSEDVVVYRPGQDFVESAAGSISTWFLGSPENDGNEVEFYIDNMRIVEP